MTAANDDKNKAARAIYSQIEKEVALVGAEDKPGDLDWRLSRLAQISQIYADVAGERRM